MNTIVQKWGNSLALRIPQPFAKDIQLHQGSEVNISLIQGRMVVKPINKYKYTLASLLKGIRRDNLHSEHDWGKNAGQEIW